MNNIGIKILHKISYEEFESFQYLLEFNFDFEDMEDFIREQKVIELDMDEPEEREDDLEVLEALLRGFDTREIKYKLYENREVWKEKTLNEIARENRCSL